MNAQRYKTLTSLLVGGVLMLAIWALFVYVTSRPALKVLVDMTPQRVNSVDPVTVELLRDLRTKGAKIELHLFTLDYGRSTQLSDPAARKALQIRMHLAELTRLLVRRYEAIGGESVTFVDHDQFGAPGKFREAAQAFGYTANDNEALVVSVTMPGKEPRWRKLSLVSDLAVIELPPATGPGRQQPVPILKDFVGELAISSSLKSLLVQGTPVAYLLRGYSTAVDFGLASPLGYGKLMATLEQAGFEVRSLNFRETPMVPADASLVLVMEPRSDFAPRDADVLYAYLKRGGRVFVNYAWSPIDDMNPAGGRLGELLGYELSREPVFHKVPDVGGRAGQPIDGVQGVGQLAMHVNPQHPTTKRLAEARQAFEMGFARELRERGGAPAGVRREPLLMTGPLAWLAQPDRYGKPDLSARPGVRLDSKVVGMAFDVDPEAAGDDVRPGRAVVVSGIFCNNASFDLFGGFALNVCNWMAERRVLMDIRGSRYEARSLDVKQPQLDAVGSLLVWWVPVTFAALGVLVWSLRRR